jgi:23S rRNA (guanine745-N1)-methyltransferase
VTTGNASGDVPADSTPAAADSILRCPYCRAALQRQERAYRCPSGHSFDIARQGYVNLLPAAQRRSKDPGDNRDMILARRRFLESGFYAPISDAINGVVAAALSGVTDRPARNVLDAGAGEGYYLARLEAAISSPPAAPRPALYGVDISRHGMQYATHRSKAITWLVASVVDLPLASASLDIVLSVFAPLAPAEFGRVLRADGTLVVVGPGPRHLYALRQQLYAEVTPHEPEQLLPTLAPSFSLLSERRLGYELILTTGEQIGDLLTMTPFGWNIDQARRAAAEATAPLRTTVDVAIRLFRPVTEPEEPVRLGGRPLTHPSPASPAACRPPATP